MTNILKTKAAEAREALTAGLKGLSDGSKTADEVNALADAVEAAEAAVKSADAADALLARFSTATPEAKAAPAAAPVEAKAARSLGEHFAKTAAENLIEAKGAGRLYRAETPEFDAKASTDVLTTGVGSSATGAPEQGNGTTQYGKVVAQPIRRNVVADVIPSGVMSATSLTYWAQDTDSTESPAATAENAKKKQIAFKFAPIVETLKKITAFTKVSDESIEDTDYLVSVIDTQMVSRLAVAEEVALLSGDGKGANIKGLLAADRVAKFSTVAKGVSAEDNVDVIHRAKTAIANLKPGTTDTQVGGYIANAVIMSPAVWEGFRLIKDKEGRYIGGGPFGADGSSDNTTLWGLRVIVTPAMNDKQVLVGDFTQAQVFRKGGVRLDIANQNEDDFVNNRATIRVEERLLLAVYDPRAFVLVDLFVPSTTNP